MALEPRDERDIKVYSAIAMWLGGAMAIAVACVLPHTGHSQNAALPALIAWCVGTAVFTWVVFRRVSNRVLSVLTNTFSTLGALTVCLAGHWSGGPASGLTELYFFPVLYDAYFFRGREMLGHLTLNSLLALSPLVFAPTLAGTQFAGHAAMLVTGFWCMSIVIWTGKQRLLSEEMRARRQALTDPLTGVHNLRSLSEQAAVRAPGPGAAVLLVDVDDFKAINSRYGHLGADRLLASVAHGLLDVTRPEDCVARIGGDEFAVLVRDRTDAELQSLRDDCAEAARRARAAADLAGPDPRASVGLAVWPRDGRDLAELLDAADRDMYAAKATHRHDRARRDVARASAPAGQVPVLALAPASAVDPEPPAPAGALRSWWRARPLQAKTTALAWTGGALMTLAIVMLPGADTTHRGAVVALAALAALVGIGFSVGARAASSTLYTVADVTAVGCVTLAVYLTGGTTSPLLPLVFLVVATSAYFLAPLSATVRLAGAVLVCATPMLYASGNSTLEYLVRFVALVTTASVLVGIIAYNKHELEAAQQTAQELAEHDPLTGLANRRAFYHRLDDALGRARQAGSLAAIAIIDLDNFKRVNDRHGHAAGDAVLRTIAASLGHAVRCDDCVARIGGDEFALVVSAAEIPTSQALGLRCVRAVQDAAVEAGCGDCQVSATVGFAVFPQHAEDADRLIEVADQALMDAKDAGKRRVAAPDWTLTVAS
jgi:diguanylate cyclase (GGDEF)-like protein